MTVVVDRTFTYEVYFLVRRWLPIYRHFNRLFCDCRRRISLCIMEDDVLLRSFIE